jgi:[acyl-carrier-protein] S-malonyltransferase
LQKFGFIFPGQGSQKLGMLAELAQSYPIIQTTFAEASDILSLDLWRITKEDSDNRLDSTEITQPVLLTSSVAIWRVFQHLEAPKPVITAGHSLGEYSALVCAGALAFADAVALVHRRGQLMQQAVAPGAGKMAAIVGLENYQINEICDEAEQGQVVAAANFNSPGQTVIAGDAAAVERAMVLCKEAGAKRALPLNVSVPSHCDLMRGPAKELEPLLAEVSITQPVISVVQNASAEITDAPETIRNNLIRQLYSPVLWVDCVQVMAQAGARQMVECGPGRVLCGLVKRIDSGVQCFGSEAPASLTAAVAEMTA